MMARTHECLCYEERMKDESVDKPANGAGEGPVAFTEVSIVKPTAEEAEQRLADLEVCMPYWKETPALLVIKPDLGLIVAVQAIVHDAMGFTLRLAIEQKLVAPRSFDRAGIDIGCGWNQPYMFFSKTGISAPYSFDLHFGSEGVARARELYESISRESAGSEYYQDRLLLGRLRRCFD